MVEYAIETSDLVKRFPTSIKKAMQRSPWHARASSLKSILEAVMMKGHYMTALDGVTFKVKKREVFGLLGPNGAGKTTLIKILCTLILHDEGNAYVNGFDVKKEPQQVLRNLQAVIGGGFDWRLTTQENLDFYASLYGLSRTEAKQKISYLLKFAGLEDRASDMYQTLSVGMKHKLVICRSLLPDVPILLFDEPTRALDPPTAVEIRNLLYKKLSREEGKTVFLSTHNMWEAQEICDRIAILDHGKIIACDAPDNIRRLIRPEKIYSISFPDSRPVTIDKLIAALKRVEGLRDLKTKTKSDGSLEKLTLHLADGCSFSSILDILSKFSLDIRSIESRDPPLEEAFITLTSKRSLA